MDVPATVTRAGGVSKMVDESVDGELKEGVHGADSATPTMPPKDEGDSIMEKLKAEFNIKEFFELASRLLTMGLPIHGGVEEHKDKMDKETWVRLKWPPWRIPTGPYEAADAFSADITSSPHVLRAPTSRVALTFRAATTTYWEPLAAEACVGLTAAPAAFGKSTAAQAALGLNNAALSSCNVEPQLKTSIVTLAAAACGASIATSRRSLNSLSTPKPLKETSIVAEHGDFPTRPLPPGEAPPVAMAADRERVLLSSGNPAILEPPRRSVDEMVPAAAGVHRTMPSTGIFIGMVLRKHKHTQVPVWIRLRHLPVEFWTDDGLSHSTSACPDARKIDKSPISVYVQKRTCSRRCFRPGSYKQPLAYCYVMNAGIWNVRGLNRQDHQVAVKELVSEFRLQFLGLLEPRVSAVNVSRIQIFLPHWSWFTNYNGPGNLIWLAWDDELLDVLVLELDVQFIHCRITIRCAHLSVLATVVYGANDTIADIQLAMTQFRDCILDTGLIHLPWPCSHYHCLNARTSDHSPCVIRVDTVSHTVSMFRFDNYLTMSSEFTASVQDIWQHQIAGTNIGEDSMVKGWRSMLENLLPKGGHEKSIQEALETGVRCDDQTHPRMLCSGRSIGDNILLPRMFTGRCGPRQVFRRGLDEFANLSGLHANPQRASSFYPGQHRKSGALIAALQFQEGHFPLRLDSIQLSFAGRLQLIKSVLMSLNVYWRWPSYYRKGHPEVENGSKISCGKETRQWGKQSSIWVRWIAFIIISDTNQYGRWMSRVVLGLRKLLRLRSALLPYIELKIGDGNLFLFGMTPGIVSAH
ncbi:hypothetical protein Sango_3075400 [Sesamum angolense]|uniref:Uncharacterized protein n=1 Tax=Sesamum angolense TaxID=2727404 RepID=A0AAE1VZC2_9LAMI|nr:hypothetical protein Sango_3075400 [Sesamum angolense]